MREAEVKAITRTPLGGDKQAHGIDVDEWRVRAELAALYRLVALQGWDDLIFTHISARIPGEQKHFLINPFGTMFEEVRASDLVKVDHDGRPVDDDTAAINRAGYVVHSAVHEARPDAMFVIHLHSLDGIAVASQMEGLLPLNQRSLAVLPRLSYHDYEGIATDLDERARLAADLGNSAMMILRNHGTLAIGRTAGEAWQNIYQLETACSIQIRALAAGRDRVAIAGDRVQQEVRDQMEQLRNARTGTNLLADTVWAAALRRLQRNDQHYDL